MFRVICILIGYGIGCIQSAYLVGKIMHVDLRQHGSGNLGSTNALRVLGKKAGAITFGCDLLKSICSFYLCHWAFPEAGMLAGIYGCVGTILGHDFPFYLGFRGGKGIAAMIGMVLCLTPIQPFVPLIAYGIGMIVLIYTKYVSLGSMVFAVGVPIGAYLVGLPQEIIIIMVALCILALFRHRSNMVRLMKGKEHKLGQKKKEQESNAEKEA